MKDNHFLKLALAQAKIKQGSCSPNPPVGSIIVDSQQNVISKGYHSGPGFAHAEIAALNKLGSNIPSGCTMYVTLEPCCHWGRTPPCVDAIIKSGIKRVVYALKDPNPIVLGKSAALLQAAGIVCDQIEIPSITEFYKAYSHWHKTNLPYVIAKIALSLNGAIAYASGQPAQITGKELQKFTHQQRKISDGILTTIETILHDDPQLNVRLGKTALAKHIYVVDTHLRLPITATLFKSAKSITVFHSQDVDNNKKEKLIKLGVICHEVSQNTDGLSLNQVLELIGKDGIHHLWVEAGGKLFASLLRYKLLQQAYIYISLHWLNHGKIAFPMGISLDEVSHEIHWRQFGSDVLCKIEF